VRSDRGDRHAPDRRVGGVHLMLNIIGPLEEVLCEPLMGVSRPSGGLAPGPKPPP